MKNNKKMPKNYKLAFFTVNSSHWPGENISDKKLSVEHTFT